MSDSNRSARRRLLVSAAVLLAAGCAVQRAAADSLNWDPGSSNGATLGGGGTWNLTGSLWYDTTLATPADVIWNNAGQSGTPDDAIFGGSTAGSVAVGTDITANTLTFNTSAYTLGGGTLTLAGGAANTFNLTTLNGGIGTFSATAGTANVTVAPNLVATINTPFQASTFNAASSNILTLGGGGTCCKEVEMSPRKPK